MKAYATVDGCISDISGLAKITMDSLNALLPKKIEGPG